MDRLSHAIGTSLFGGSLVGVLHSLKFGALVGTATFAAQSWYDPLLYRTVVDMSWVLYYRVTGTSPPAPKTRPKMRRFSKK